MNLTTKYIVRNHLEGMYKSKGIIRNIHPTDMHQHGKQLNL